jgi:excisionase family DNA binding protein
MQMSSRSSWASLFKPCTCSRQTVYMLARQHEFPEYRIGARILFARSDVSRFLTKRMETSRQHEVGGGGEWAGVFPPWVGVPVRVLIHRSLGSWTFTPFDRNDDPAWPVSLSHPWNRHGGFFRKKTGARAAAERAFPRLDIDEEPL